jgi:hypothetical protein
MRYWGSIAISGTTFGITMNVIGSLIGVEAYKWRVMILIFSTLAVYKVCMQLETWLLGGKEH